MFFFLSKTVGLLLLPSNLLIGMGLVGLLLLPTRFVSLGRKLVVVSMVLIIICGSLPLGKLLLYPLESRFPPWDPRRGEPTGIVVLGGIEPNLSAAHGAAVFSVSDRLIAAVGLARNYPKARILYSGGNPNLVSDNRARDADFALPILEGFGLGRDRVIIERDSRNTEENAEFSKALADPKSGEHWLLVTSAYHMPRSIGIFRKAGFPVEPYPVDWRVSAMSDLIKPSLYPIAGLGRFDMALHEWVGLIAYWVSGKTSEFFPGPDKNGH